MWFVGTGLPGLVKTDRRLSILEPNVVKNHPERAYNTQLNIFNPNNNEIPLLVVLVMGLGRD